ncbi:MAG: nuclear transport factor 2 family protein [Armatimonadota bacterium]|nr:nuclear transport factor 2 family protein [Armatimonadota bacterium]
MGGIFGKSKRGESDRDESSRVENRPSGSGSTRTGEVYRSTPSSSNRPKRTDQVARPSISTSGRSWSGQRTDRVFTRVYETRRDWRVRYHSYDYRHRPSFHGGFYYYGSSRYDPYYYGYYCFSYVPRYTYPSLYFYYGTFPYMYRDRIVFISFPFRRYVYVPLYVYGDDFYRPYYQPYPGYYLSTSNRREMRNTLDDIQEAWERADYDLIMRHVRYSERVHVYFKDQYEYSVDFDDYRDMTRDAMETIDTIGFEFYKVSMRYRDEVVAYGRHKYYDDDDKYSVVNVTYTLERRGGEWYITEVGSSPRSTSRL